jgi:hypothetical protein
LVRFLEAVNAALERPLDVVVISGAAAAKEFEQDRLGGSCLHEGMGTN